MLVIALIAIILSVGVINAFIPIIIIIILIAAGAGAMRGFNLFNAFGVATLVGGGPGTVGGATRGTIARSGFPLRAFLDAPTVKRPAKYTPFQERKNFGSPLGLGKKSQKLGGKTEGQEGGGKKADALEAAFIEHLDTMHKNAEAEAEELKRRGGMVRLASPRPTGSAASSPFTNPGAKEKAAYDSYAGTKTTTGTKTKAAQMAFAGFGGERTALLASIKKARGREREVLLSKLKEARVSNSDQRKTRIDANDKAMKRSMKQMMVIARRRVEFGINGPARPDKLSGGEINALINMGLRNEGDRTPTLSANERNAFAQRTEHDIATLQAQKKIIDNYFSNERTAKSAYQKWSSENAILGLHGYDRMRLDRIDEERKKAAKAKRRKDWRRENIYNPIARSVGRKPKDGQ